MNNDKIISPGLVIRETASKDNNAYISILTATHGVVGATAYGARKSGASLASGTRLFNYADFTLIEGRGRWKVDSCRSIETFFGLSRSVEALAAASYFMELLYDVCVTGQPDPQILRLALNCLYSLMKEKMPVGTVKAIFELRLLSEAGFTPELGLCGGCASENTAYFSAGDACFFCPDCAAKREGERLMPVSPGAAQAMRYIISAPIEKLFSFSLGGDSMQLLEAACERYALEQTGRKYDSLNIYHSLAGTDMS